MSDDHNPPIALPVRPTEIRPKDSPITLIVDNTGKYCSHGAIRVCERSRSVKCGTCGAPLDAFDSLLQTARLHDRQAQQLANYRKDIAAAVKRLEHIKRLENNARARLKRSGADVPDRQYQDEYLSGALYMWVRDGRIEFGNNRRSFTPDEAEAMARRLMREAEQARKGGAR